MAARAPGDAGVARRRPLGGPFVIRLELSNQRIEVLCLALDTVQHEGEHLFRLLDERLVTVDGQCLLLLGAPALQIYAL
jgi:hypothetical protein